VLFALYCALFAHGPSELETNSNISSNPTPSVQNKIKVRTVGSIVAIHIFLSLFHTHSYSFLITFSQRDKHLLDVTVCAVYDCT